jgi:hypothetical protein
MCIPMHGFFVGVNNYFTKNGSLSNILRLFSSSNDTMRISSYMLKHKIITSATLINDDYSSSIRPTRNMIIGEMVDHIKSINKKRKNNILFFFSGHGFTLNKKLFLMPCDFDSRIPEESSININDLLLLMQRIDGNKLVLLDCCRTISRSKNSLLFDFPPMLIDESTYVLTSCSTGQVSFEEIEIHGKSESIFSKFLIQSMDLLRTSKSYTFWDLFYILRDMVSYYTMNNFNVAQIPSLHGAPASDLIIYRKD